MQPKVSVLLPTYNHAPFISEAIESALCQTFTDFELIIVDNCSTDNTTKVIAPYLADARVKYYCNPTNIGAIGNFNKCLEYATGTYIKYLLSDDKFAPTLLEKLVAVMDQYPNVAVGSTYWTEFGTKEGVARCPLPGYNKGIDVITESLHTFNFVGTPTAVMYRRSNMINEEYTSVTPVLADWEMNLRQLAKGDCYIIPEVLSYYRDHPGQFSKKGSLNFYFELYEMASLLSNTALLQYREQLQLPLLKERRAIICCKNMYKLLPKLYKRKYWPFISKGIRISIKEGVVFTSLRSLDNNFLKQRYQSLPKRSITV